MTVSASLTVHVYADANADATQDAGDTNLAGVAANLLNADGTPTGVSAVTDASGNVTFSGLIPNSYKVSVVLPAGAAVTQHSNVLMPITLASGQTGSVIEGVSTASGVTVSQAAPASGANADVGVVAVGAPVYAADAHVLTVGAGRTRPSRGRSPHPGMATSYSSTAACTPTISRW